jgi:hypothetical protein
MRSARRTVGRSGFRSRLNNRRHPRTAQRCLRRAMPGGDTAISQESLLRPWQSEASTALSGRSGTRDTVDCHGRPHSADAGGGYATNGQGQWATARNGHWLACGECLSRAANLTARMACKRTGPPAAREIGDPPAAPPQRDLPRAFAALEEPTDACRRARSFRSAQPHLPVAPGA